MGPDWSGHDVDKVDRSEDGAVAIIVAMCLLVLFGAGAIAIDLGSGWETKRELVIDTDAAALAGAQALDTGDCDDAETAAESFLAANTGDPSINLLPGDDFDCDATGRTVRVDYTKAAQQTLSGALGYDEIQVLSSSTALVAERVPGGGLRPFSVCMTDPDIKTWIDSGAGNVHRLDIEKTWKSDPAENCEGGGSGNWGYVCYQKGEYNAGSCSASSLATLVLDGYTGTVDLQEPDPDDGDCDAASDTVEECEPITGSINANAFKDALDEVTCDVATAAEDCNYQFAVLGVNSFTGSGSGAEIHPTHFIGVVLRDWEISGSTGYLDFELLNLYEHGTSAVLDAGTLHKAVMCATDHVEGFCD